MERIELSEQPIPAGTLTVWAPTVLDNGAWRPDSRPLTPAHEAHCRRADPHAALPGRGNWVGAAFPIDRPYHPDALRTVVRTWFDRHETLRTSVTLAPGSSAPEDRVLRRHTVDADHLDALRICLGHHSSAAVRAVLVDQFDSVLSPLAWPHCVLATVTNTDQQEFVLFLGVDRSVMDTFSHPAAATELREMYQRLVAKEPAATAVVRGHFPSVERQAA
jgi:hypothetical protein